MSMFDTFTPVPAITCPLDGEPVGIYAGNDDLASLWQGKSGPRSLLHFTQGERTVRLYGPEGRPTLTEPDDRLSERFELFARCRNGHELTAEGRIRDGIWAETELLYVERWGGGIKFTAWGQRPAEPLWPHDAAEQLSSLLGEIVGFSGFVQISQTGLTVTLRPTCTPAARAAIPTTYAGRPVEIAEAA